jgi:hypothetical protein
MELDISLPSSLDSITGLYPKLVESNSNTFYNYLSIHTCLLCDFFLSGFSANM